MAESKYPCKDHMSQNCQIYCVTCDCIVCTQCVTTTHRKHEFAHLSEMVSRKRLEFQKLKSNFLEKKLPEIMEVVTDVKQKGERYDKHINDVSTRIEQQASAFVQLIGLLKNKFSEKLRAEKDLELQQWWKLADDVEKKVSVVKKEISSFEEELDAKEVRHLPQKLKQLMKDMDIRQTLAIPIKVPQKWKFERYKIDEIVVESVFGRLRKVVNEEQTEDMPLVRPRQLPPRKCEISISKTLDFTENHKRGSGIMFLVNMDEKQLALSVDATLILADKFHTGHRGVSTDLQLLCRCSADGILAKEAKDGENLLNLNVFGKLRHHHTVGRDDVSGDVSGVYVTKKHHTIVALYTEEDCFGGLLRLDKDLKIMQRIETKEDGTFIFAHPYSIAENGNYDLWVTDIAANSVEVIDELGLYRFSYEPKDVLSKFEPKHVVCDANLNALISDIGSKTIHVLDRNGVALRYLQTYDLDIYPLTLAVEREGLLWVGEFHRAKVHLIRYF